jgi:hypothetical protein
MMKGEGHVALVKEITAYILVLNPRGKRPLGRPKHR